MLYTYVYMYITCTFISVTAMTEYGWRRENGKLEIDWEVQENIEKAKMSLDFVLKGCKCKTGCKTRICLCRKKERQCDPSNNLNTQRHTRPDETDLVVQELLEENNADTYTDDSDDGLEDWRREEMDDDEELRTLMEFVFGSESDYED